MVPKQNNEKNVIDLLNTIPGLGYKETGVEGKHLDAIAILSLPKHLRKTAIAMHKANRADAGEISEISKQMIAVEEKNLEELVVLGYLRKEENERTFYLLYY